MDLSGSYMFTRRYCLFQRTKADWFTNLMDSITRLKLNTTVMKRKLEFGRKTEESICLSVAGGWQSHTTTHLGHKPCLSRTIYIILHVAPQ
jgi:hypothetical protein